MGRLVVERCTVKVGRRELGLTRDKYSRALLRIFLEGEIASAGGWTRAAPVAPPANLQNWVDAFSDTYAITAVANLGEYFRRRAVSGLTLGGRRSTSKPLVYDRRQLPANPTELGAVGEGVAGFYLEGMLGLRFDVRPFGVNPDFVFMEPRSRGRHLVQVKTSLASRRTADITEAINLLDVLAKTKFLRSGKYFADVVSINVLAIDDFTLRHFGIEEV